MKMEVAVSMLVEDSANKEVGSLCIVDDSVTVECVQLVLPFSFI